MLLRDRRFSSWKQQMWKRFWSTRLWCKSCFWFYWLIRVACLPSAGSFESAESSLFVFRTMVFVVSTTMPDGEYANSWLWCPYMWRILWIDEIYFRWLDWNVQLTWWYSKIEYRWSWIFIFMVELFDQKLVDSKQHCQLKVTATLCRWNGALRFVSVWLLDWTLCF